MGPRPCRRPAATASGQTQELGSNRAVYAGVVSGVIFNDVGKGFLHKAGVDCTLMNDVNQGREAPQPTLDAGTTLRARPGVAVAEWSRSTGG